MTSALERFDIAGPCIGQDPRHGRPRMLLYSHDTFGLGHLRRSLKIADAFHSLYPSLATLLVTGSPVARQFQVPPGLEIMELPPIVKVGVGLYEPRFAGGALEVVLEQRRNLIFDAVRAFTPDLFLVDHSPTGVKGELLKTLFWLREHNSPTVTALGMRDILDSPERVRAEWEAAGIYSVLDHLYDRIFIYGTPGFFDPVRSYGFGPQACEKTAFTGFILESNASLDNSIQIRKESDPRKLFITLGGGEDGVGVLTTFLEMIARHGHRLNARSHVLTGPFFPQAAYERLAPRAARLGVRFETFIPNITSHLREADLVIAMGGYNTVTEILRSAQRALILPRVYPRQEQLVRAQRLSELGLIDCIPADQVTSDNLYDAVIRALARDDAPLASARETNLLPLNGAQNLAQLCRPLLAGATRGRRTAGGVALRSG